MPQCRDAWLAANYKPGMSAAELIEQYRSFGDDPFIVALPGVPVAAKFSGLELCGHTRAGDVRRALIFVSRDTLALLSCRDLNELGKLLLGKRHGRELQRYCIGHDEIETGDLVG